MFDAIFAGIMMFVALPFVFYGALIGSFFMIALGLDIESGHWVGCEDDPGWFWPTVGSLLIVVLGCMKFGITFESIKDIPTTLFLIGIGYFAIGTTWSFAKWYFHLTNVRDTYIELKQAFAINTDRDVNFLKSADVDNEDLTAGEYEDAKSQANINKSFYEYISSRMHLYAPIGAGLMAVNKPELIGKSITPIAMKHKSRITQWIAFWPVSAVWTIINDPVRKIVNAIFASIKGLFQRMSDSMFAGV